MGDPCATTNPCCEEGSTLFDECSDYARDQLRRPISMMIIVVLFVLVMYACFDPDRQLYEDC